MDVDVEPKSDYCVFVKQWDYVHVRKNWNLYKKSIFWDI